VSIADMELFPPPPPLYPPPDGAVQVNVYVRVPLVVGMTTWDPLVASVPDQAPDALHEVALLVDQVTVALWPTVIVVGAIDIEIVGASGGPMFPLLYPPPQEASASVSNTCSG